MPTIVRDIHGFEFSLDDERRVKRTLNEDGVLVICSCSDIPMQVNAMNVAQALKTSGDPGIITLDFLKVQYFLPRVVGKALFLLRDAYNLGASKVLIPLPTAPGQGDTRLESFGAYTAMLFGTPKDAGIWLDMTITTASDVRRGDTNRCRTLSVRGGDIVLCTNAIKRTVLPRVRGSETVFVYELYYYDRGLYSPALDSDHAEIYMGEAGSELYLDGDNVVWSKDNFENAR